MDSRTRRRLATHRMAAATLSGYSSGPDAPLRATADALARAEAAKAVIIVEGISDQIAIEAAAARLGLDLDAHETVVLPVGGAQAAARYLLQFGPLGAGLAITGMCDVGEAPVLMSALKAAGIAKPTSLADLASEGFSVCDEDLEDELIRAHGVDGVCDVLDSHGDLKSFATMRKQPAWRGRPAVEQLRRFLGAGAKRKLRYARLLVETLEADRIPRPLTAALGAS